MKKSILSLAICAAPLVSASEDLTHDVDRLTTELRQSLGQVVAVKRVQGTELYSVAFDDKVFFTDTSGSVLIDGDVLTLSNNVVVSNLIKEDYRVLYQKQQVVERSRLSDVNGFINKSASYTPSTGEISQTKQDSGVTPTVSSKTASDAVPTAPEGGHPETTDGNSVFASYTPEQRECLALVSEPNDLSGLYQTFGKMTIEKQKLCGQVMAGAIIPKKPDSDFIVYEADNPVSTVTMFSDYTCNYCVRDHKNIEELNRRGVTVRVAPYGRGDYREVIETIDGRAYSDELSILGKNYTALSCSSDASPEQRKHKFEELMANPNSYKMNSIEPDLDPDKTCELGVIRDKLMFDLYATRGTPLYVFEDGSVNRGALTVDEILDRTK
ncbi:hypothetical protein L1D14_20490 [Vibrio tubiashii]|uniref:hypothetical protein n=1 Tax=Vibrio tubiashii TaxID=29498 RepID=UPI001EFE473A|nr:hypothetical protein [Vibrio tubiashii]MCG9578600.1 hypothetical protein [Vibrio tubiashii]